MCAQVNVRNEEAAINEDICSFWYEQEAHINWRTLATNPVAAASAACNAFDAEMGRKAFNKGQHCLIHELQWQKPNCLLA